MEKRLLKQFLVVLSFLLQQKCVCCYVHIGLYSIEDQMKDRVEENQLSQAHHHIAIISFAKLAKL